MRIFHIATNAEIISRINPDPPSAVRKFQRFQDFKVTPSLAQLADSSLSKHFDEWLRGPIKDGQFERIYFDVNVVDVAGIKRGQKVLGRRKQHALFHKTRG